MNFQISRALPPWGASAHAALTRGIPSNGSFRAGLLFAYAALATFALDAVEGTGNALYLACCVRSARLV
jgi:hypothetical protein